MSFAAANSQAVVTEARAAAGHKLQVLLSPPNLVTHARLLLAALAAAGGAQRAGAAALLFAASIALDAADGWLARLLKLESVFGAYYDVAVDISCRAVLWTWGAAGPWAALVPVLEALTFGATHAAGGAAWKAGGAFTNASRARATAAGPCSASPLKRPRLPRVQAPLWVRAVMAGGLRSPAGALAVAGLWGCPLWLWARRFLPGAPPAAAAWGLLLVPCRLLAAAVEGWVLWRQALLLLQQDAVAAARKTE